MTRTFRDRTDAGEALAERLLERGIEADLVLAIPRGGLPAGRAVADALGAPLDVIVAKKIGAPGNPEYAIGAVASDGSVWRNERALVNVGETDFERSLAETLQEARWTIEQYRGTQDAPDVAGKQVVVVDDGVATGSTVRACLAAISNGNPSRVILAIPVGPADTVRELEDVVDEVVCLETPAEFRGVGQCYERFDQVTDEEAIVYLEQG